MPLTHTPAPQGGPVPATPAPGPARCAEGDHDVPECPAARPGAILTHPVGAPDARYAHLRSRHPVFHDPDLDVWVISRHRDIDTVLRDATGTYSTALSYTPLCPVGPQADAVLAATGAVPVLSSSDPPEHTRFRRAMTATLPATDRAVRARADLALAEETAAAAAAFAAGRDRRGDLLTGYAQPAVLAAFGRLSGVPRELHRGIAAQAAALTGLVWGRIGPDGGLVAAHALAELWAHCARLVAERRGRPGSDLVGAWLAHTGPGSPPLTDAEVASTLMEQLIVVAELLPRAVTATVGRMCAAGAWPPPADRRDEEVRRAVDDAYRHHSPLAGWLRSTTREVELSGVPVPAGARLLLLLASAHRDPDRPANAPSLSFGAGIHYCPGAALTHRLTRHAVASLAEACPTLALADPGEADPETWPANTAVHAPDRLTVTW
ncbi:hypothetical protein ABZ891_00550 [Streptomyces sp. NPDC047023]|uniref:hypothetical protein n=1 Tax=Streptomyces sp. NPDC047023 TaxID=3155139 RepID=UPI0033FFC846